MAKENYRLLHNYEGSLPQKQLHCFRAKRKMHPRPHNTAAIQYGKAHEKDAISSYLDYHRSRGIAIEMRKCVDVSLPWLAASPDRIVTDSNMVRDKMSSIIPNNLKCAEK